MVLFVVLQWFPALNLSLWAPPTSAGTQDGMAVPGASGHERRPGLLQGYQGTNG